jgi:peptidoglycan/xylan/chitin deacetylase (PgdA/CDA1 family)
MRRRAATLMLAIAALAATTGSVGRTGPAIAAVSPAVVTIQFDDGNANQVTAAQMLAVHGMVGTFYVNTGFIGQDADHLTWTDLTNMSLAGNEIAGHTLTHANLKHLKPTAAQQQICQDRQNLIDNGFQPTDFAYPFGAFDAGTEAIVKQCGYSSGRGVAGGTETIPPLDPFATRTPPNPKKGTQVATIEGYVTDAQNAGGGWVQLVFHNVCLKCDAYAITPAHFEELLTWLDGQRTNGSVLIETTQQVMSRTGPP